jgi:hypothetical protein
MADRDSALFEQVQRIIAGYAGIDPRKISMESDLRSDLGISGDDGDELFTALDAQLNVDWSGLDLGIHFGNEGFGYPLPWQLKNNCVMYEAQPCRVSDIAEAAQTGKWPGTAKVLRPLSRRLLICVLSALQHLGLIGTVGFLLVFLLAAR